MAPLYMVRRPRLLSLLLIFVFLLFVIHDVSSLLVYNRMMLLKIRDTVNNLPQCAKNRHSNTPPPLLASVPAYLWRPVCALPRNKRRRRRGKRGGLLVKLKAYLASLRVDYSGCSLNGIPRDFTKFDLRRSLEYCYRWLRPALPR
ncbi:hypothetical protein DPX16_22947 [Anabarilius grahami]|uniref:Uncharacterized protein n=1 Tax=Anabarilius grahami TaxID=495550 RepID=A0A3N0Y675_ANAGA|nr:hypothetical protein DPX16_22947 [Anabarilius grahami]